LKGYSTIQKSGEDQMFRTAPPTLFESCEKVTALVLRMRSIRILIPNVCFVAIPETGCACVQFAF